MSRRQYAIYDLPKRFCGIRGLAIGGVAIAGKSTLPVLSNILLAANDDRLKLVATALEIDITCWIGAKIEMVGGLLNDKISLQLDPRTQTVAIKCARYDSSIKGIEADEFPVIPTVSDVPPTASFPPALLRETID